MYVTCCKLCPLSSIITENVLDVCKPLQIVSFSPNSDNLWLNLNKWISHESKMTKIPSYGVHLVRFNHKKLTELRLKDIICKGLQTSSTFSVIIEDKGHRCIKMPPVQEGRASAQKKA
ncbi:hypothetical protein Hanom_Chr15g01393541 [Helianthus anomalus]